MSSGVLLAIVILVLIGIATGVSWLLKVQLYTTRAPFSAFVILLALLVAGYIFMTEVKSGKDFPVRKNTCFRRYRGSCS